MNLSCPSINDALDLWLLAIMDSQLHLSTHSHSSYQPFNILNQLLSYYYYHFLFYSFSYPSPSSSSSIPYSILISHYPLSSSSSYILFVMFYSSLVLFLYYLSLIHPSVNIYPWSIHLFIFYLYTSSISGFLVIYFYF